MIFRPLYFLILILHSSHPSLKIHYSDFSFARTILYLYILKMEADPLESGNRAFPAQTIKLKFRGSVNYLYPAFNDSFFLVVDVISWESFHRLLLHCSQDSEVFWQKEVKNQCKVKMCSDEQVIYTDIEKDQIVILNLRTHSSQPIPFKFMGKRQQGYNASIDVQIYIFQKRKLFCLFESFNNIIYFVQGPQLISKLTYFSYDKVQSQPICVVEPSLPPNIQNFYKFRMFQMNNDCQLSLVYYLRSFQSKIMYLCGLNQDNVGSVEEVKLANPHLIDSKALEIGQSNNRHMFDVLILKELEPQSYLLAAVQGHLMQFFILDTTPGHQQAVISKIVMGDDCFSHPMSISRFVFFQEESLSLCILKDPIKKQNHFKMIDWHNQEVIDLDQKFDPDQSFSPRLMKRRYLIQYSDKNNYVEIKLLDYRLTFSDGFLHMLLHLNEDFDDDLLQDCITLLQ